MEEQKLENQPEYQKNDGAKKRKLSRKKLCFEQKQSIFTALLLHSTDGKLNSRSVCGDIALKHGCSVDVVQRIWQEGKRIDASNPVDLNGFLERLKSKRSPARANAAVPFEENLFKAIPRHKRRSFRSMAYELHSMTDGKLKGHSKSSLHRKFKSGSFRKHSNAIRPSLTMYNKIVRCEFVLSLIVAGSLFLSPVFEPMYDVIHVDEKWFYITEENMVVYLANDEPEPERHCKSKRYKTSMFWT